MQNITAVCLPEASIRNAIVNRFTHLLPPAIHFCNCSRIVLGRCLIIVIGAAPFAMIETERQLRPCLWAINQSSRNHYS